MREQKGITLLALVITIIVLIILASISINMINGNNSLINNAGNAKESSEIADEKEIVDISTAQAMAKNKYGSLIESEFQDFLNTNSNENAKIVDEDEESFIIKFENSNRYYNVLKTGEVSYLESDGKEKHLTIQCVNSENTVLAEQDYLIINNRYSKTPPQVAGYEVAENKKIEGTIDESKTVQVLYYLLLQDDSTLVFTGLDSNENVTTEESEIVSYMVGDGVGNTGSCGLVSGITCKSILIIPSEYKGKKVTILGKRAFQNAKQIVKVSIPDSIKTIQNYALGGSMSFTEITLPENLNSMAWAFFGNSNLKKVSFTGISGYANGNSSISAFQGCINFSEIATDENNLNYKIINGILYSNDETTILKAPNKITGDIVIGDSVTKIVKWAFSECRNITSVTFGENVTSVGDRAFQSCNSLTTIIINSPNVAKITDETNFGWLLKNSSVNNIYIKDNITMIGSYITENYTLETSDKEGYVKYIKNQ